MSCKEFILNNLNIELIFLILCAISTRRGHCGLVLIPSNVSSYLLMYQISYLHIFPHFFILFFLGIKLPMKNTGFCKFSTSEDVS